MASPYWQATGTIATGTGNIAPNWPTHIAGDIGLLIVTHDDSTIPPSLSPAAGFVIIGSTAAAGQSAGTIWWCRATSAAMSAPTVIDSGDGNAGLIMTVRGCVPTGDPWDNFGSNNQASTQALSISPVATTLSDLLLVTSTHASHAVNDTLALLQGTPVYNNRTSMTVRLDQASGLNNNGECLTIMTGPVANPYDTGTTTATIQIAARAMGHIAVALKGNTSYKQAGRFFPFFRKT